MRILFVAPELDGINSTPEIRTITELHTVTVYNGEVSLHDLYEVCRNNNFDIIHVVSHSSVEGNSESFKAVIALSSNDVLTPQDLTNLASFCKAKLVFLNTCNSAVIASYATLHGVPSAIFTNIDIKDKNAWIMPMSFYTTLAYMNQQGPVDYHRAFSLSAPSDGVYGWSSSHQEFQEYLLKPVIEKIDQLTTHIMLSDENMRNLEKSIESTLENAILKGRRLNYVMMGLMAIALGFISVVPDLIFFGMH